MLKINKDFIEANRATAIPIQYDLPDSVLYPLLEMINGVHFTGGGLTLINPTTGEQHPYYQTAKKIFEYSKTQKTTYNKSFPLTGICQGFELLSFLASGDK